MRHVIATVCLSGILSAVPALANEPTPEAGGDCCALQVSWHPYASAYFADPTRSVAARRTHMRIERATTPVTARFREHGICLEWQAAAPLRVGAGLRLLGKKDPAPDEVESLLGADAGPAIVFVERLEAFDSTRHVYLRRRGMTPRPGARLAIVSLEDRRALPPTIENELYHLLGLRDAELGANEIDARHVVTPPMWTFLRRACETIADRPALAVLIAAKDACVAASGDGDTGRCYTDAPKDTEKVEAEATPSASVEPEPVPPAGS